MATETDLLDLALDADGDLDFTSTDVKTIVGADGVKQLLEIALQTFQGEWFFDEEIGVPYFQDLLGQKFSESKFRAGIRSQVLATPFVTEIVRFEVLHNNSTRETFASLKVKSRFGDVELESAV